MEFRTDLAGLSADQLEGPFFVGWLNPPDAATHLELLEGSDHVVLAVDHESGQVVGYITAISDGVLTAFIPQLEVVPDYQRRGIGTELVQRLLEDIGELYAVDAVIDADVEPFYRHLGMSPARAVMRRDYERQSGRR
ncbi:MAG: GNAT family N-acetyltransferase [Acidimicrobiia bacterium]|nr:GNAT family N-acetyltransferase [Acidimicrobiia bacterium]NNF68357.1 GNAT family N-acetyltransferase [Acidimicrobiia bacterium]NNK91598.1 GNAT family N-acetyltransferase [Acidimicrobiia bacterium]